MAATKTAGQGAGTRLPQVKRRDFLRGGLIMGTLGSLGAFSAAALAQLWPSLGEGFGAVLNMSQQLSLAPDGVFDAIQSKKEPIAFPAGRLYLVTWNPSAPGAMDAYGEDHTQLDNNRGIMALYHRCVHLGCRVPWCQTSQWFECPCHGSKYNKWGEWVDGPAPRGLDRFPSVINDAGDLEVNTGLILTGPARTANVLAQEPEGPHCIDI
ncbi:MAG: ubiquinol-cytochrome c reductase iron-sulfur subunit [Nitriliruptorales bacterium]